MIYCIICLEPNKEFIQNAEILKEYRELVSEIPASIPEQNIKFCLPCVSQLKKFINFKHAALSNLSTVEAISKCQTTKKEVMKNNKKNKAAMEVPKPGPKSILKLTTSFGEISTGSRVLRKRSISVNVKQEENYGERNTIKTRAWKKRFENVLKNQPFVKVERCNLASKKQLKGKDIKVKPIVKDLTPNDAPPVIPPMVEIHFDPKPVQVEKDSDLYCSACDLVITTTTMYNHIMTNHCQIGQNEKLICDVCKNSFPKRSFASHFDTHRHFKRANKCDLCPFQFARVSMYKRHYADKHKVKKPKQKYTCVHCFEEFSNQKHLKIHLKTGHAETVQCYVCGEKLLEITFNQHMAKEHGRELKQENFVEVSTSPGPSTSMAYDDDSIIFCDVDMSPPFEPLFEDLEELYPVNP